MTNYPAYMNMNPKQTYPIPKALTLSYPMTNTPKLIYPTAKIPLEI